MEIVPFQPGLRSEVVELIVGIQRDEFAIDIRAEQQPDLLDIPSFYQVRSGNFWVAIADGRVVGTISLLDIGDRQGALRKMFVRRDFRGPQAGTATRLLDTLLDWARDRELREIFLGTTSKFLAAHRFYEKNGFSEIERSALPRAFPIMAVDSKFYQRRVEASAGPGDLAPSEGSARVGAASVHWRRQGSGPAVVLLHGFPLSGCTWDGVVSHLRDRFTCYTPDLIGLGRSQSAAADDHSSQGQARALQSTLTQLGVGSYALVGNDTGGWIARELALLDAPRVTHLVLTNTEIPFQRPPWIPMYQALAHVPGFRTVMRQALRVPALRRSPLVFGGCFHDLAHLEGEFHRRFVEPLIGSGARMEGALEFLRRMKFSRLDAFQRLHQQLTLPTLFVWGADDPTFPEARAREMALQFPNVAGFHTVKNAKLFVYEEHPQQVARHIERFIA